MKNNPYKSNTFISIWLKHFYNSKPAFKFKSITDLSFVKNKFLPLYVNVGKNLTNGLSYSIQKNENDYKGKVFFIYDIPEYFNVVNEMSGTLKLKTIRQYKGYLVNLSNYNSVDHYLADHFSTKSRWKINKSKRRLEACFNIKYGVLYGKETLKEEYDIAFNYYNTLLKKRFVEKQINNHYLAPKKWEYLKELIYPMILEQKAAIFVIYSDDKPISVYLNFVSDAILYSALPVFDTDYSKFNLGYIDNLKHIEWCIENKIDFFDFSKGDYDYKKRLGNREYHFDYHILYDSKSITARLLYLVIILFFNFKQYLREKNIHILFHKIIFYLKGYKNRGIKPLDFNFNVVKIENDLNDLNLIPLDFKSTIESKYIVFDFLYRNSESINNVRAYKMENIDNTFIIQGKNNIEKIILK